MIAFDDHIPLVYHIAKRMCRRPSESIIQAGLEGLWHACKRFDSTRGFKFSSYAGRCIRGLILSELEHERGYTAGGRPRTVLTVALNEAVAERQVDDTRVKTDEARREVTLLLQRLPPLLREVIELHDLEGASLADIASRLCLSPSRIQQRHAHAMELLQAMARGARLPAPRPCQLAEPAPQPTLKPKPRLIVSRYRPRVVMSTASAAPISRSIATKGVPRTRWIDRAILGLIEAGRDTMAKIDDGLRHMGATKMPADIITALDRLAAEGEITQEGEQWKLIKVECA